MCEVRGCVIQQLFEPACSFYTLERDSGAICKNTDLQPTSIFIYSKKHQVGRILHSIPYLAISLCNFGDRQHLKKPLSDQPLRCELHDQQRTKNDGWKPMHLMRANTTHDHGWGHLVQAVATLALVDHSTFCPQCLEVNCRKTPSLSLVNNFVRHA